MKTLLLFDVDNTIVESGKNITSEMITALQLLSKKYDLGILGGGTFEKIKNQLESSFFIFKHVFTECGCIYHYNDTNRIYHIIFYFLFIYHGLFKRKNISG